MTIAVSLSSLSRHYGDVKAVDNINLDVNEAEFFALLGPSGSGKTTCLRLIAGFENPTQGHIQIFGQSVDEIPPYRRNVNTVFQDYALFPHLNVIDNVAYSLMINGVDKSQRIREAERALEQIRLPGYGHRKPAELSGGQRQRVALARAIINKPKVLLLDEPLGALDLKLREQMQEELKALQQTLGITFILVTHDQGEALSMADRIAIFNEGKIVQVDPPEQLYQYPVNRFVARFVGSSNVIETALAGIDSPHPWASLRPEAIRIEPTGDRQATVMSLSYLGSNTRIALDMAGVRLNALVASSNAMPHQGQLVCIDWDIADVRVMEGE